MTSTNLREWTELSAVKGDADGKNFLFECPDFYELPVAGGTEKRWVLSAASGDYAVGTFDGTTFKPEEERLHGHSGSAYYAAQTFSGLPDGRRVLIGWLLASSPGMPFNQGMTLPQDLGLVNTPEGLRLTHAPVKELATLRGRTQTFGPVDVAFGGKDPLAGFEAELPELRVSCELSADAVVRFDLRGIPVQVDAAKQELMIGPHKTAWPVKDGKLGLIIYLDRTSIEVYSKDGLLYAPVAVIPQAERRKVTMSVEKGTAQGVYGEVYALRSCWEKAR
jgi:sucrose-6-phosphate hydrolase SacC (GH32 family)